MSTITELLDSDDVGAALQEGRPLHPARHYHLRLAVGDTNFRKVTVPEAAPLGRQIIEAGKLDSAAGYSLAAILASGDFADIRMDERFDLSTRGTDRFIAFLTDRLFKFDLNAADAEWGKPLLGGVALYALAKPAEDEAVFREDADGEHVLVEPTDVIDLSAPGIEHFITAHKTLYEIIVNARRHRVAHKTVSFEQIVQIAFPGPHAPNVVFSMTYRHAASQPHAGELGPGGTVNVKKKGTIFNVTRTIKS
jgi:hypothetical protein